MFSKKHLWWLAGFLGILCVCIGIVIYPIIHLLFPSYYFAYYENFQHFHVYSEEPVGSDLRKEISDAKKRLTASPIHDSSERQYIFLCSNNETYASFAKPLNASPTSQGLNILPLKHVIISLPNIRDKRERFGEEYKHTVVEGNLAHIIAHEITHGDIQDQVGMMNVRSIPQWKDEGFAEYAATIYAVRNDHSAELKARIRRAMQPDFLQGYSTQRLYIHSQILVEYLMEEEQLTFDELMKEEWIIEKAKSLMMQWLDSDNHTDQL